MDELQALIEKLQRQSGSNVVDLRYRAADTLPWAVSISWGGGYVAVVPDSSQKSPIDSLNAALHYIEYQKNGKPPTAKPPTVNPLSATVSILQK